MSTITITSDFGQTSHYLANLKAYIIKENPAANIIDISNTVNCFDIEQGAFLLKSCYKSFPDNSVHIFAIEPSNKNKNILITKINNQYIIGGDNGFINLIENKKNIRVYKFNRSIKSSSSTTQQLLGEIAGKLANKEKVTTIAELFNDYRSLNNQNVRKKQKPVSRENNLC